MNQVFKLWCMFIFPSWQRRDSRSEEPRSTRQAHSRRGTERHLDEVHVTRMWRNRAPLMCTHACHRTTDKSPTWMSCMLSYPHKSTCSVSPSSKALMVWKQKKAGAL